MADLSPELQQRAIDSLDKIAEWVENTETFAAEQAPLVVEEIIRWGIWSNVIKVVVCLIAGTAIAIIWRKLWVASARMDKHDEARAAMRAIPGAFLFVFLMLGTPCMAVCVVNIAQAVIAPRLYVIEQLGGLL